MEIKYSQLIIPKLKIQVCFGNMIQGLHEYAETFPKLVHVYPRTGIQHGMIIFFLDGQV